jgi:hypothetical protein
LSIYYPEFDPGQYEDTEKDYYRKYNNKLITNKLQSLYSNYKRDNNNQSPPRTEYND